jgi:hypothetical protein
MAIDLDQTNLQECHQAFLIFMFERSGGKEFRGFDHPFFMQDETNYKRKAAADGIQTLQLHRWERWLGQTGKILQAVKAACKSDISENLLEHRFGATGNSYSALYRVENRDEIKALETELYHFYKEGTSSYDEFSHRFDRFANYLSENKLGRKWAFLAYLAFLLEPQIYFPVLIGKFERLLEFLGIEAKIGGLVEWSKYKLILDVADILKEELAPYGSATAIDVQSYMYVVASLLEQGLERIPSTPKPIDFEDELKRRQRQAKENERIGYLGEKYILNTEKELLRKAGRRDLVRKVQWISIEDVSAGYDILSFDINGNEKHLEVKTTQRDRSNDPGFWLSNNEYERAMEDDHWSLVRVWRVLSDCVHEELGNIVQKDQTDWQFETSTWFVSPLQSR